MRGIGGSVCSCAWLAANGQLLSRYLSRKCVYMSVACVLATHTSGQKTPLYGSSRGRSVVASVTAVGPWLTSYEEDQQFRGSFPDYWIEQLRSRERGCGLSCDR